MLSAVPDTLFVSTVARGIRVELGCVVAGWLIQRADDTRLSLLSDNSRLQQHGLICDFLPVCWLPPFFRRQPMPHLLQFSRPSLRPGHRVSVRCVGGQA